MPSARAWWSGLAAASCGFSALLTRQPAAVRQEVRAAFLATADAYRVRGDEVAVPAAALLLSCRRGDG